MKSITIKWLIRHNACSEGVCSFKDKFGERALIKKVIDWLRQIEKYGWEGWLMAQEVKMTKFLLENGADIHAHKDFALQCTVSNGDLKVTKFLLENGADIHAMNNCVIKCAVENNDLKMIKFLFKNGADIHADKDYVILWAKAHKYEKIMSFLKQAES